MGAPKGNQNALGHGRPVKYTWEIKHQIYDDLVEWSKKPDSFNILEFTFDKDYGACDISTWAHEDDYFSKALKKAKERLGNNIRKKLADKDDPYNYGAFQREIGMYDSLLRTHEREEKKYEAECKAKSLVQEQKNLSELAKMDFSQKEKPFKSDK